VSVFYRVVERVVEREKWKKIKLCPKPTNDASFAGGFMFLSFEVGNREHSVVW
jgi:hypothetical protein